MGAAAAIIDAYERAYNITQCKGADNRAPEIRPMRDRQTMARHVRGYVAQNETDFCGTPSAKYATTSQRKALATMGRGGGKKSRTAMENRPRRGIYSEPAKKSARRQQEKTSGGNNTRAQILAITSQVLNQTGRVPTWKESPRS